MAGIGEARGYVRRQPKTLWWDMEIDVITDKANVIHLMNGHAVTELETGRAWQVTERGALKEVNE